jgi:hypothetical protein
MSVDLFICAKDLLVEAMAVIGEAGDMPPQQSNLSRHRAWLITYAIF